MNKGKPLKTENEHLSIVVIPASSDKVKVINFSYLSGKIVAVLLVVILTAVSLTLIFTARENHQLKQGISALHIANAQQKDILNEKTTELSRINESLNAFNQNVNKKINEFTQKFNQLSGYIK